MGGEVYPPPIPSARDGRRVAPATLRSMPTDPSDVLALLPDATAFRRRLLAWFDRERRDLPWRRTRDPWAVLLSEILLQQTTVSAVVPHYERLLARWPRPSELAACGESELLAQWAGLGYYRRARLLAEAARKIADDGGELPRSAAALRELPGVGEYTAAAVASITHGEAIAAVDGNVERVICRLLAYGDDPRSASGRATVRAAATTLLSARRPGDFNQAMMELGATVCRPRSPECVRCPVAAACSARALGTPERFPALPPRKAMRDVVKLALLVVRGRRVLVQRRAEAPNEGFFELPQLEVQRVGDRDAPPAPTPLADALRERHGLRVRTGAALPVHRHVITRSRICVHPFSASLEAGRVRPPLSWIDPRRLDLPLTTASRRILSRTELFADEESR